MNIVERYQNLVSQSSYIYSIWTEVERYCVPYLAKQTLESPYKIYDDTAFRSIKILASGLYSYLTSPASQWFKLDTVDDVSSKEKKLSELTDVLFLKFRESNFYQVLDVFYKNLINYGVSLLYEEIDDYGNLRFKVIHPRSFVFSRDAWGNLTEVIVSLSMPVAEVVNVFGLKNVSEQVAKKFEENPNEHITILFGVYRDYKGEKPYKSVWVEKETEKTLKEGFYDSMPFFLAQWETPSDKIYGTSPSIDALPSIILANRITKTFWVNNEKLANPPLDVPHDGYVGDIDISPGAINYRMTSDPNNRILPIITSGDINITIESIQTVRQQIEEKYYVDLFILSKDTTMTATEVIQRTQEKLLLLGSVIGRMMHDVLRPLIGRSINLLISAGLVDTDIEDIKIDFLSPLAQSQKSTEYNAMLMVLNTAIQVAQFNPQSLDIINWDNFLRKVGDVYNVDARIFNDDDTVEQIRQQQAQLQQQQLMLQMEELKGKAMKNQAQAQLNMKKSEAII